MIFKRDFGNEANVATMIKWLASKLLDDTGLLIFGKSLLLSVS
jgi:hypothetical protein